MVAKDLIAGKELFARKELIPEKEVIVGKEPIVGKEVIAHIMRNVATGIIRSVLRFGSGNTHARPSTLAGITGPPGTGAGR